MIYCNALDFNECRSKEVISFFWRSFFFFNEGRLRSVIDSYMYYQTGKYKKPLDPLYEYDTK